MADGVRHSRQVVAFDAEARGWAIRESADENSPPPHVNRRTPAFPPVRCQSPKLNLKRCKSGPLHPINPNRPPVPNTSIEALHARIARLESELEAVKTAYVIQNKLLDGIIKIKLRD